MSSSANKKDVAAKSKQQQKKKKSRMKPVLESPFQRSWPDFNKNSILQVQKELVKVADEVKETKPLKPIWKVLKEIKKEDRINSIAKFREDHLKLMSQDEKEEALKTEKLSHLVFGYNQIMRAIQKDEIAALLLNLNATPQFLPMTFLPACLIKNIPAVPIPDLDQLVRKCIAIGLKKSVEDPINCFNPLYKKMVQTCADFYRLETVISKSVLNVDPVLVSDTKTVTTQSDDSPLKDENSAKYPPEPEVEVSKYYLKRTRNTHRVFIPGVGINQVALMDDSEFITLPELTGPESAKAHAKFSFRNQKPKKKCIALPNESKEFVKANGSIEASCVVEVDVTALQSEMMFVLDVGGVNSVPDAVVVAESSNNNKHLQHKSTCITKEKKGNSKKRKCPDSSVYLPAAVKKIVGNMKRKNK